MMPDTDAWNTSTVNILSRMKQNPPTPTGISISDLKYTILESEYVYRNAEELAELHSCDPSKLVNSYVAFKPARLALHEAIVAVVTTVQVEAEAEMQTIVARVHQSVLDTLDTLGLDMERNDIKEKVTRSVDAYLLNPDTPQSIENKLIVDRCIQVRSRTDGYVFGQYKAGYTERDAMIALATDSLFSTIATERIKAVVTAKIKEDPAIQRITIPEQSKRTTLLVTGGISSGKGSSVSTMKFSAEREGVSWRNIAKINGDSLKPLLLEPNTGKVKPELYSQLAQEEASLLTKIKIKGALRDMIRNEKAPHMFFDQTRIEDDAKWGIEHGGQVIGLIVSTDIERAIPWASARGIETGRYEATQNIINNHKAVAEELMTVFVPLAGQLAQFTLVDNNVPRGTNPIVVMTVDTTHRSIVVLDEAKLGEFTKKCNINPGAINAEQLYTRSKTKESYLTDLIAKTGYTVDVPSIAPEITVVSPPEVDPASNQPLNVK